MVRTKLTKLDKIYASYYNVGDMTSVADAKKKAIGRFWNMKNSGAFYAINKRGRRKHFGYERIFGVYGPIDVVLDSFERAKKSARKWAQGSR